MGQAGRRKIERFYTWDTKIDRILDFYREAVQPTEAA
jgi:glycosyltransferase involved in cell wall biosynthesis